MTTKTTLRGQLSDIDLRLLRVFKAVAECGGYGAAELELNINRSTISIHMSDLEHRLGINLCHRGRGRTVFSLSEQGKEVYIAIVELFAQLDSFRSRINAIKSELTGKLRIALPDDWLQLTQEKLSPAIARFRQKAPQVELEVLAHAPDEIDLDIMNNRADIAINVTYSKRPGLEYKFLYAHCGSLYCGDKHPLFDRSKVTREEVLQCDLITTSHAVNNTLHKIFSQFPNRAVANHMSGRMVLLLSGGYVGFIPDYFAKTWLDQGRIKKLDVPGFDYTLDNMVIYKKQAKENPLIKLLVAEIFR